MGRMSVATISNPEFIDLQPLDINPLMSKCEIKVLYVGENRNGSYITQDVATEMAKTLRGAPIVGWYSEDKQDFVDHGDRVTFDGEGIKFETLTKPYGFVAPNAEVWFQDFEDTDEFGNKVIHTYLMTTGYLWTGQYEEAKLAVEEGGRPQSMELDEDTMDGHWAKDNKSGLEFFIINDAIFSKLCILGDDVEPCFEGANITAPEISTSFTLDDDFKQTLYDMMKQLKFALGGQPMTEEEKDLTLDTGEPTTEPEDPIEEKNLDTQGNSDEIDASESNITTEGQEESQSIEDTSYTETGDDAGFTPAPADEKYTALETQFNELQEQYAALQSEYQSLVDFKNEVENQQKKSLIDSFYMLSDEDKADVITNMTKYSLDEIEAKLSVICVRKKINFNLEEGKDTTSKQKEPSPIATYTLDDNEESSVPAWIAAVQKTKDSRR